MADRIRVDSNELQQCVREYSSAMNVVLDAVKLYTDSLQALAHDYTGKAAAIMSVKVVQLTANITQAAGRAADAISELTEVKSLFETNESALQSKGSQLDEGVQSPFTA